MFRIWFVLRYFFWINEICCFRFIFLVHFRGLLSKKKQSWLNFFLIFLCFQIVFPFPKIIFFWCFFFFISFFLDCLSLVWFVLFINTLSIENGKKRTRSKSLIIKFSEIFRLVANEGSNFLYFWLLSKLFRLFFPFTSMIACIANAKLSNREFMLKLDRNYAVIFVLLFGSVLLFPNETIVSVEKQILFLRKQNFQNQISVSTAKISAILNMPFCRTVVKYVNFPFWL